MQFKNKLKPQSVDDINGYDLIFGFMGPNDEFKYKNYIVNYYIKNKNSLSCRGRIMISEHLVVVTTSIRSTNFQPGICIGVLIFPLLVYTSILVYILVVASHIYVDKLAPVAQSSVFKHRTVLALK